MKRFVLWPFGPLHFAMLLAGCSRISPPSPDIATAASASKIAGISSPQNLTLIAIDNSGSTDSMRKEIISMAYDVATDLKPEVDSFKAYAFASDIHEVTSEVPMDEDAFAALLTQDVIPTSKDYGTDYSKVMKRLADESAASSAHSIRLIIAGDGFTDDVNPAVTNRFEQAEEELAANHHVTDIVFYGIKTGAREQLEGYLKGGSYQLHFIDLGQSVPPLP